MTKPRIFYSNGSWKVDKPVLGIFPAGKSPLDAWKTYQVILSSNEKMWRDFSEFLDPRLLKIYGTI